MDSQLPKNRFMGQAPARDANFGVRSSGSTPGDGETTPALSDPLVAGLLDALPTPVLVLDSATGSVVSTNRAFLGLVGLAERDVIGASPPFGWWASEDESDATAGPRANRGKASEALFRDEEGRLVPVEVERVALPGDGGSPALELALVTDLRERRALEQQVVQSGKLAAIGQLAAGVAHEINNPLFAILGFAEFLRNEVEPGTRAYERLLLIQQTGLEIKAIVRALLDFAREPSDVFMTVSLTDVAAQTVELIRRTSGAKDVEIVERYPDEAPLVEGSPNQLKQIFLNLLTNAQQAMPNGGTITVELRSARDGVQATVADTGPGIPDNVLARIFEPFYTSRRDQGGTGLGLSVSLGIAEMHGGSLSASSVPGKGATFTLRLPLRLKDSR